MWSSEDRTARVRTGETPIGPFAVTALEGAARLLLAGLWAFELSRLVLPVDFLQPAALTVLVLYIALAASLARRRTLALCAALGAIALGTALAGGRPRDLVRGLENGLIFTAFIPTLAWLRAAAERSPAIAASQAQFETMSGRAREAGLLVGAHLLGAVLTAGVFGLFAPLLPHGSPAAERSRAAQATVRGMCLAVLWSPCFVGMALASRFLPEVALWQVIPAGFALGVIGLVLSDLLFGRREPQALWRAAVHIFRPMLGPLAIGAVSVVAVASATPYSSLEAVLITLPPLGFLWLMASQRRDLPAAVRVTWRRLGLMGDDLLVVIIAMVLAAVLAANPAVESWLRAVAALGLPPAVLIAGTLGLILIASFTGLHPMVGISVLVPLLAGLPAAGIARPVLMMIALYGWSLGTINSPSSLSVVLAAANFRLPYKSLLLDRNLVFVLVYGALAIMLLSAANALWPA